MIFFVWESEREDWRERETGSEKEDGRERRGERERETGSEGGGVERESEREAVSHFIGCILGKWLKLITCIIITRDAPVGGVNAPLSCLPTAKIAQEHKEELSNY